MGSAGDCQGDSVSTSAFDILENASSPWRHTPFGQDLGSAKRGGHSQWGNLLLITEAGRWHC
jgi:hypothetical protein